MSKADKIMEMFGAKIATAASIRPDGAPAAGTPVPMDRYANVKRTRAGLEIEVAKVLTDPQVREAMDAEYLERLTVSVKQRGVLQPIRVRWDEVRGSHICVAGHCRLEATKRAGLERIPAVLVEADMAPADVLIDQLVENMMRSGLTPLEEARGYKTLQDATGWTAKDVAGHVGVSESAVSRALALIKLPEPIAEAVEAGKISARAGAEIARVTDAAEQSTIAQAAIASKMTPEQVAQRVRNLGKSKSSPRKVDTTYRATNGVRLLVTTAKRHTPEDVAAALREIADKLQPVQCEASEQATAA